MLNNFFWKLIYYGALFGGLNIFTIIAATKTDIETFALFAVLTSIFLIAKLFVSLNIGRASVRHIIKFKKNNITKFSFFLLTFTIIILSLLFHIVIGKFYGYALNILVYIIISAANEQFDHLLRANMDVKSSAIARVFGRVLLIILILVANKSVDTVSLINILTISELISLILIIRPIKKLLNKTYTPERRSFIKPIVKKILYDSIPISINAISIYLYTRVDILILDFLSSRQEVAKMELVNQVLGIPLAIVPVLGISLSALLLRKMNKNKAESNIILKRNLQLISDFTLFLSIPMIILTILFYYSIVKILPQYQGTITIFYTLLPLLFIKPFGQILSGELGIVLGHAKLIMKLTLLFGVLNAISDLLVARSWGSEGVALSTLFIHSIGIVVSIKVLSKEMKVKFPAPRIKKVYILFPPLLIFLTFIIFIDQRPFVREVVFISIMLLALYLYWKRKGLLPEVINQLLKEDHEKT